MITRPSCSACLWVHRQLGSSTPCPWHAGEPCDPAPRADQLEARATSAQSGPTANQPWPFTAREYARLLLLRSRVRELEP